MASTSTADEVLERHLRVLGPNLGSTYNALYNELVWLHVIWQQFRELFGVSAERIETLNEAAPLFFRIVQDSLWEETLLGLCRITDRTSVAGRPALTVRRLPDLVENAEVKQEIESLVADALTATAFARDWRNRQIAHRDLALALSNRAEPLAFASRARVSAALTSLDKIIQRISAHFFRADLSFELIAPLGDAADLLRVLGDGLSAERARMARLLEGKPLVEDLSPSPSV